VPASTDDVILYLRILEDGELPQLVVLLHQTPVHLPELLRRLSRRTAAAAAGRHRPLILGRPRRPRGLVRGAVEAEAAQELGHVAHVHLGELLHVLRQVVALHLIIIKKI